MADTQEDSGSDGTRADRTCGICGKVFTHPSRLKRHLKNKKPCAPILAKASLPENLQSDPDLDSKRCRFCGRTFATYQSRWRHEKQSCKINRTDSGLNILYEHTKRTQSLSKAVCELKTLCEDKDRQIERLEALVIHQAAQTVSAPAQQPQHAIQANGYHTTVNQIQRQEIRNNVTNEVKVSNRVTVNVFGQEKVDHITAPQIYQLLMNAKGSADPGIQALLDTALVVFSDPAKPENLTCYLPNKKTSDALVHEAEGWQIKPIETVLSPMVQRSLDVLFRKQPFGHEPGLPDKPDIMSCGEVLKQVAALEADPSLAKKTTASHGPLRTVLVRNKDVLARANGGTPPMAGEE